MKYLYYQSPDLMGLGDLQSRLSVLCREAVWLGRTPVFPSTAPLDPKHNFHAETDFPVSRYIDTECIEARCFVHEDAQPLEMSFPAALWADMQALNIPQHEILEIAPGTPITAAQNKRFRLIVRQIRHHGAYRLRKARPLLAEAFAHGPAPVCKLSWEKEKEVLRVVLHPSRKVRELAQEIIRRLPQNYCVVHVRRGDLLQAPAFRTATDPAAVLQALERAGVARDAPVYLMTDERSRRWLRRLQKRRPILHCADFPRLKALVTPPPPHHGEIDNYFLYAVEKEILRRAQKVVQLHKHVFLPQSPEHSGMGRREIRLLRLYAPAEIMHNKYRVRWGQIIDCWFLISPPERRRLLRETAVYSLRSTARYLALRLFRPKVLRRFRDKRKALGLP